MSATRIIASGAVVNIVLAVGKMALGSLAGSRALIADGVHSLSDLITDGVVLIGVRASRRPADDGHAFGHGRYETISALIVGVVLLGAGLLVGRDAAAEILLVTRGGVLLPPEPWAAAVALASVATKEVLFHVTYREGVRTGSLALKANAWHHRTDAISSVAATAGILGAAFAGERWRILDPLAALLVATLIVVVAGQILVRTLYEMTDAALPAEDCEDILRIATAVAGVHDPHGLRTRRLGQTIAVELHFRVDGSTTVEAAHGIASQVERAIRGHFGEDTSVITHVEPR